MATIIWTGGDVTDAKWSRAANWDLARAPLAGDDLHFAGSTRPSTTNDIAADTSFASITFDAGAAAFTLAGNRITLAGAITVTASSSPAISLNIILSTVINVVLTNAWLTLSGVLSGASGGLNVSQGANNLTLSNSNTFAGGLTMANAAGKILLSNVAGMGTGSVTFNYTTANNTGQGGIDVGATDLSAGVANNIVIAASAWLNLAGTGGKLTLTGILSGTGDGGVVKAQSLIAVFTGANTYQGQTRILNGSLSVASVNSVSGGSPASNLGAPSSTANGLILLGTSTGAGGTLIYTGTGETSDRGFSLDSTTGTSTVYQSGTGALIFSGAVSATRAGAKSIKLMGSTAGTGKLSGIVSNGSGTVGIIKDGTGTWTISGANTCTGNYVITTGTLVLTNTYATTSIDIASGAVFEIDTSIGNLDLGTAAFTGAGTLRKIGTHTVAWNLASATFALSSGALIDVQRGSFVAGSYADDSWGSNLSDLTVAAGAEFGSAECNVNINRLSGGGNIYSGYSGLGYLYFTMGVDNGTGWDFTGVLADNIVGGYVGNYRKIGTGTQTLSGTNTYTGSTTVGGGTLKAGSTQAFGVNSAVIMTDTASTVLDTTGFNNTIGSLTGGGGTGGNVTLGAATLTIGGDNTSPAAYAGAISGTGAIIKSGTGALTLSGSSNSYSGTTTINGGSLLVNGAITGTGAITVANTATLGGTGTVAGVVSVSSGGTVAPGNGDSNIGTLGTPNVTFNATSTFTVDLNGTTPTYDQLNSSGTVALGVAANTLTVNSMTNPYRGKTYTIINAISVTGTFNGKANNSIFTVGVTMLKITYSSTQVILTDVTPNDMFAFTDSNTINDVFWSTSG